MVQRRREQARRARRGLLWGCLLFLGLHLTLGLAIELCWPGIRAAAFAERLERLEQCRRRAPGRPLILMLGTSRGEMGFEATRLNAALGSDRVVVFNCAVPGAGPIMYQVQLDRLRANGIRPDLLLVEVLLPHLSRIPARPLEEEWFESHCLTGSELLTVLPRVSQPVRLAKLWALSRLAPERRFSQVLRERAGVDTPGRRNPFSPGTDAHGYTPRWPLGIPADHRAMQTAYAAVQYREALTEPGLAEAPARAMRALLERCRAEGIPTAMVLMPEGSQFRARYAPATRAALEGFVTGLSRDLGVPLIDARTWVNDADFWDTHHMLPTGAIAFTDRLEGEVRPLISAIGDRRSAIGQSSPGDCLGPTVDRR